MKYLYLLGIIILSTSCSNNTAGTIRTFESFPKELTLKSEEIKTPPVLFQVVGMELLDSVLITLDMKADKFFQVFKLPTYDHLGGFVSRGNGPGEEFVIYPYFKRLSENRFIYQTITSIKTISYNLKRNAFELLSQDNLPSDLMNLIHIFKLEDNFYGYDMTKKSKREFIGYNPIDKRIFEFGPEYPIMKTGVSDSKNSSFFAKTSVPKPDNTLFASVYDKFPILRIYSKDGVLQQETRFENEQPFPQALLSDSPSQSSLNEIVQNYRKIKTTTKYIYALYVGKTVEEMGLVRNGSGLDDFSNEIHVWDWDGLPVKKIVLDKKCFSFVVSPLDDYILTSSINSIDTLNKYIINAKE